MAQDSSKIYQFKISLKEIRPMIWRRIEVPADFTFKQLHGVIQCAMGWKMCHLFVFRMSRSVEIGLPFEDDQVIDSSSVKLSRYFTTEKQSAVYEYDFGDSWEHKVTLEKILVVKPGEKYPKCTAGKRACPPEDCGSTEGYENHVEIVNNKDHEEYKDHMEWLERIAYTPKDPEDFDPKEVTWEMMAFV